MKVIPIPKYVEWLEGNFKIEKNTVLGADSFTFSEHLLHLKKYLDKTLAGNFRILANAKDNVIKLQKNNVALEEQSYILKILENQIIIQASSDSGLYYGITTFCQLVKEYGRNLPMMIIEDSPDIKKRGILLDVTRGRVPKISTIKRMIKELSFYKINQVYLYVEHAFEYSQLSEAWRGTSAFSAADILEIKQYAKKYYMELVPAFASLGHLYQILMTKTCENLVELENVKKQYSWLDRQVHHMVDVSNPQSMKLIKDMIDETLPLFDSEYFNLCCDETFDLGRGKSRQMVEKKGLANVYCNFVSQICNYVEEKGKRPMIFGDIVFKFDDIDTQIFEKCSLISWNYDETGGEEMTSKLHEMNAKECFVMCGTNGWNRFVNDYHVAMKNIRAVSKHALKYRASGMITADWGDMGHFCMPETSEPMLIYGASYAWNIRPMVENSEIVQSIAEKIYGKECADIIDLLEDLYENELFHWADVACYQEIRNGNSFNEDDILKPWVNQVYAEKITYEMLKKSHSRITVIKQELERKLKIVNRRTKNKISKLLILADGIDLANAYLGFLKKIEFHQSEKNLVEPRELALQFEYWFNEYERCWRENYRESELEKIRYVIYGVCNHLREYECK